MTDKSDYWALVQEAKKLAAECEFGEATLIAAAVICLDRIFDQLETIAVEFEMMNAVLEKRAGDRE